MQERTRAVLALVIIILLGGTGNAQPETGRPFEDGAAAFDKEQYDRAIGIYTKAIKLAYYSRGTAYQAKGEYGLAIADYGEAIRIDPEDPDLLCARATAYQNKGDPDRALSDYERAVGLKPHEALLYFYRGSAYQDKYGRSAYHDKGALERALSDYTTAVQIDPALEVAYLNRGTVFATKGAYDKAVVDYLEAIRLAPAEAMPYANLAWVLATCPNADVRNGKKALKYGQKARELSKGKEPFAVDALAAAYAEIGDFPKAVELASQALDLTSRAKKNELEERRARLKLYQQRRPYRMKPPG